MNKSTNVDRLTSSQLRESRSTWWSVEFTTTLLRLLSPLENQIILDVGCGLGTLNERLQSASAARFSVLGIDLDLSRLRGQHGVAAAQAEKLPFSSGTFTSAVSILTLQHIPDRQAVLAEMRRVVRAGGLVLAVEADNLDQRIYLQGSSYAFQQAYAVFWRAVAASMPTVDFSLGPNLFHLFKTVGLPQPRVHGFLVTHAEQVPIEGIRRKLFLLAERYELSRSQEFLSLLTSIEQFQPRETGATVLDSISTVPLFLVSARVPPAA